MPFNCKSSFAFSTFVLTLIVGLGMTATVEKRDNQGYDYGGGYNQAVAPYVPPPAPVYPSAPVYPPAPAYGGAPAPGPYPNPGFSVQTGFEGFLVPNSWYGLLPWGVEGVIIVIVGIIVFFVIGVFIVGLLAWLTGFGDYAIVKESARSLIPSRVNLEALADMTNSILDALDKFDEIETKKID